MKDIIIVGRPRAGKSTLANRIADKYNYQIIRTDTIRNTFRNIFPELNIGPHTAIDNKKFQLFVHEFLRANIKEARNKYGFVVEGCEMSLKDCEALYGSQNNLIYVLGQIHITPEEMAKNIEDNDTDKDWSRKMNKDELVNYCRASIEKAKVLKEESKNYKFKFYDTCKNREEILDEIMLDIEKNIGEIVS